MKKNLLRLLLFVIAGLLRFRQEIQTETFDNGTLPVPRGGNTVTLSYDNLPSTGVGLAGKRYIAAIRFDASTLVAYPEYSLNSVDVYLRDIPHNGFFLNIYRGGNSSAPGALVYKKFVAPSQLFSYSWNNITIDTTLSVINNNSDIWVGIDILAVTGQTVFMSLDSGPGNPNGSKIFIENQWRNLSFFGQGINKNWNLKLKIAGPSTQLPAKVQIVHNSPEPVAKNVDVFVNGQRVLSNFEYKKATPFLDFQPNTAYSISLTLPGQPLSSAVVTFNASFNEGENYVAAVQGDLQTGLRLVARPGAEVTGILGVGRIYATHGSPDAPEVDIRERTAGVLFSGVSFGEFTNYISLPLADYTLDFTLPGLSTPVVSFRVDLSAVAAIVAPVFATGYLNPASSSAPGFGLFAVLTDGTVIEFPKVPSIPPPPPPTGHSQRRSVTQPFI
ncbi:MAG: DUF4397 domain-containing protein [Ignavibacteriales bacterium]|nr:DUF4397 domain-containing protein [Ignavibacteriales bacterium]